MNIVFANINLWRMIFNVLNLTLTANP